MRRRGYFFVSFAWRLTRARRLTGGMFQPIERSLRQAGPAPLFQLKGEQRLASRGSCLRSSILYNRKKNVRNSLAPADNAGNGDRRLLAPRRASTRGDDAGVIRARAASLI